MKEFFTKANFLCKNCGKATVWYHTTESFDGGDDCYHYHCHSCGHKWRVWTEYD